MNCTTCHYHDDNTCRARPPTILIDDDGDITSAFPPVDPDWWCGDWSSALPLPWPFFPVSR